MALSAVRRRIGSGGNIFQTAGVAGGGTAVYTIPTNDATHIDYIGRYKATVFITSASGGHLAQAAALVAECVVVNKNGTVTFNTAIATSINPVNSNTAGFALTSRPETRDAPALDLCTAVWTLAASVLTLTITNNGSVGPVTSDITAIVESDEVQSQ